MMPVMNTAIGVSDLVSIFYLANQQLLRIHLRQVGRGRYLTCMRSELLPNDVVISPDATSQQCGSDQYMCDSGQCIAISFYCDFKYDCLDHSDESQCGESL